MRQTIVVLTSILAYWPRTSHRVPPSAVHYEEGNDGHYKSTHRCNTRGSRGNDESIQGDPQRDGDEDASIHYDWHCWCHQGEQGKTAHRLEARHP